jgi:hypothetical protein
MKKFLFYIVASVMIVSMFLFSCKNDEDKTGNNDNAKPGNDVDIFVLDISLE